MTVFECLVSTAGWHHYSSELEQDTRDDIQPIQILRIEDIQWETARSSNTRHNGGQVLRAVNHNPHQHTFMQGSKLTYVCQSVTDKNPGEHIFIILSFLLQSRTE
jgi:hypothetical protein